MSNERSKKGKNSREQRGRARFECKSRRGGLLQGSQKAVTAIRTRWGGKTPEKNIPQGNTLVTVPCHNQMEKDSKREGTRIYVAGGQ